jgi:hypothetical protein
MPDSRSSPETAGPLPPVPLAAMFADFVDVLIPGDDRWPSASAIGVQGLLLSRMVEEFGEAEPRRIADALVAAGAPFTGHDPAGRRAIVERLEAARPDLFAVLRSAVTLAYYESPVAADAIRALGRPYLLRPHLVGYPSRPFDAARDTPTHGRGRYLATDEVTRIDISGLHLETARTQNWGIKR